MKNTRPIGKYPFIVQLHTPAGGGPAYWFAEVPDLPGCIGTALELSNLLIDLDLAMQDWIDTAKQRGQRIPGPSNAADLARRLRTLLGMDQP